MAESRPGQGSGEKPATPVQLETATLFQGKKQLHIYHDGVCYTLRITSNNKLILTK